MLVGSVVDYTYVDGVDKRARYVYLEKDRMYVCVSVPVLIFCVYHWSMTEV